MSFETVPETMPGYERLIAPLLMGYLRKQNARSLTRLREQLERDGSPV